MDFGEQTEDWNDKIIDGVIDFVCMLLGFGLVFTIYKIVKRFCSRPLLNVDSIIKIGNNDVVQDQDQDQGNNSDDHQPGEVTHFRNPFLNDEEGASAAPIATSKNHFLTSSQVNAINGVQQDAYEPVAVPQIPTDYPLSALEERDRRLSRLSMADFPPPPTLTAQQRLKIKKSATVIRSPEFSQMTLPPPPTPVETVTQKSKKKPPAPPTQRKSSSDNAGQPPNRYGFEENYL